MQKNFSTLLVAVAVVVLLMAPPAGAAGSGSFRLETPDAGAMGKGSAFVGEANRTSAVYYNPAGLSQLSGDNYATVGFSVLQPQADHNSTAGVETQMRRQLFVVPHVYLVSNLGAEKLTYGLGATSSWGLETYWAEESFAKYVSTNSALVNSDTMMAAAYQVNDKLSVGLGIDYDNSYLNKSKKLIQVGGNDGDFQLKGTSDGWGYRLSSLYKLDEQHQFGLMYRSTITHKFEGKVYMHDLNAFGSNYQAIFGGTHYETTYSLESKLPQSVIAGYSYRPDEKWVFNFDLEWMDWSTIEQEKLNYEDETDPTRLSVLNGGNPAARDWKSVFSFALGAEHQLNEKLCLRGGYYHHQSPIPEENFEPNIPDSDSNGFTLGFGYQMKKNLLLDFAYSALVFQERKIDNEVGSASGASVDGQYHQWTNLYLMSLTYKF